MAGLQNVLNHPTLRIELSQGEDGYIVAECLDIAGCALQGKTRAEALANIVDAISVCLEVIIEDTAAKLRSAAPQTDSASYKLSLTTSELMPA